jgi:hypothetical protein
VRSTAARLAEFYDRMNSQSFTPRGNNYVRLGDGPSTFNVDTYYAERAEAAFATMQTNHSGFAWQNQS